MSRKRLRSLNAVKMSLESSLSRLKTKVVLYTYQTTKNKGKKFGVICTLKYVGDLICGASIFCVLGSSEVERCLSFTARPTREKFIKAIVKSKLLQTYDFSCFFHCSNFLHIINMLLIYQAFSSEQVFWRVLSVWKLEVMSLPVLSDNLTRTRRNYSVAELWFTVGL